MASESDYNFVSLSKILRLLRNKRRQV